MNIKNNTDRLVNRHCSFGNHSCGCSFGSQQLVKTVVSQAVPLEVFLKGLPQYHSVPVGRGFSWGNSTPKSTPSLSLSHTSHPVADFQFIIKMRYSTRELYFVANNGSDNGHFLNIAHFITLNIKT